MIRKNIPNLITSLRIIGTFCLLFMEPLSATFYVIYLLAGLSDAADGFIARKFNLISELGSKLDSIADLLFYAVMIFKIFPILLGALPKVFWYLVAIVVILRILSYVVAAIKYHKFASLHTYMNKVTGAAVFAVPFFIELSIFVQYCFSVCAVAGLASLEELLIHIRRKEYTTDKKKIYSNE